jgi:predicted metal-dependent hydrolase
MSARREVQQAQAQAQLSLGFDAPVAAPAALPEPAPGLPGVRVAALAQGPLRYRLRRARRRTIGFTIDEQGLAVAAPRWVTLREIEAAVQEKEGWIRRKLADWHEWRSRRRLPELRFAEGGRLPYLGRSVVLRLAPATSTGLVAGAHDEELHLALPAEADEARVRDAVLSWLQSEARRVFAERIELIRQRVDVPLTAWALSSARSRWGSCSADGRVRLNWRLIHFQIELVDYVIAHELAHLKEMNHGPRFWQAVAQILPGFEVARAEMRRADLSALPL